MLDISSPTNPRIKEVARLHRRRVRDTTGRFLVEGSRELRHALDRPASIVEVLHAPDLARPDHQPILARCVAARIPVTTVSEAAITKVSHRSNPDGLSAVVERFPTDLDQLDDPLPRLVLVAESIEKPGNLGAMLRTVDAAGASLIATDPVVDLFNPSVVRASQGSLFSARIAVAHHDEALLWAGRECTVLAASPDAGTVFWDVDLTDSTAVVFGSEHEGVSARWLEVGDPVRVPMMGHADSLNASVAAAVVLYEAVRQRRVVPGDR